MLLFILHSMAAGSPAARSPPECSPVGTRRRRMHGGPHRHFCQSHSRCGYSRQTASACLGNAR